jgi:uncharacterized protein (DUF302 family)
MKLHLLRPLSLGILLSMAALIAVRAAFAQDARVKLSSSKSYEQTITAFKVAVDKGGMKIMDTYEQGEHLQGFGAAIKGTLFLVGNPKMGVQAFEKDPAVGLYLPPRVYIYQGTDGKTYLSYDRPSLLLKQFHDPTIDKIGGLLDQKLDGLVHMAAQ